MARNEENTKKTLIKGSEKPIICSIFEVYQSTYENINLYCTKYIAH